MSNKEYNIIQTRFESEPKCVLTKCSVLVQAEGMLKIRTRTRTKMMTLDQWNSINHGQVIYTQTGTPRKVFESPK